MTRGSAFTLKLCRRNILWLVGALMLVILVHLYFIKVIKTVTRDDDHFLSLPKEFLSPSHKKVSMNRFRIHLKEQCIPYKFSFHFKLRCSVLFEVSVSSLGRAKRRSFRVNTVNVLLPRKMFLFLKKVRYRAFSLTWPASMQMYRNNRKYLHKKKVYLSQDTNMDVVSLFWNPIWPPRRHVNLLHSTLFVSAETRNKGKGVPRVSVRVSPGSPRIPGTRLRSFANAKVHLVSLAAVFCGCHATLRCVTSKKTVARDTKVHRKLQIPTREK